MNLIILFLALSFVNVVFSTVRSLTTVKSGKGIASIVAAGYYSFYNIVLIYTVADFPLWQKCVITFACNLVGTWIVKLIEERLQKDKLWKIELTVDKAVADALFGELKTLRVPCNFTFVHKWAMFNCYCQTKVQSGVVKEVAKRYHAKVFANEAKIL